MTQSPQFIAAYRYHRANGSNATAAHTRAHVDTAASVTRYPSDSIGTMGAPCDGGLRWTEDARATGLRFVGFADQLIERLGHGWFSDVDGDGDTYRGAVWQLPARKGRARYLAGYREGNETRSKGWHDAAYMSDHGAGRLDVSRIFQAARGENCADRDHYGTHRDAARAADSIANREAESAREYNEAWRDGSRFASLRETIADARREALALFADMRRARRSGFVATSDGLAIDTPICRALRRSIVELVAQISDARRDRDEFAERYEVGADAVPPPRGHWLQPLRDAFKDGASLVEATQ